jgi:hypothetical protein
MFSYIHGIRNLARKEGVKLLLLTTILKDGSTYNFNPSSPTPLEPGEEVQMRLSDVSLTRSETDHG